MSLSDLTNNELKAAARHWSLPLGGKKSDLVQTLIGNGKTYASVRDYLGSTAGKAAVEAEKTKKGARTVTNVSSTSSRTSAVKSTLSTSKDKWEDISPDHLEVVEYDSSTRAFLSEFQRENDQLVATVDRIVDGLQKSGLRGYTRDQMLFISFAAPIAIMIHKATSAQYPELHITGEEMCQVLCVMMIVNMSMQSNEGAWDRDRILYQNNSMTFERFNEIATKIEIVLDEDEIDQWAARADLPTQYREACKAVNDKMRPFRRRYICLDDDIIPTESKDALNGAVAMTCIPRKGGWGPEMDIASDVVSGTACYVSMREPGGEVVQRFAENYGFEGGEFVFNDRYYVSASNAILYKSKNVASLGPMKSNQTRDHCFDIHVYKKWDSQRLEPVASRIGQGIAHIDNFPGAGPRIYICRNRESRLLAFAAVGAPKASTDGVIKLLASPGAQDDSQTMLQTDHAGKLVRIPKPISPRDKRRTLFAGIERKESEAMMISQVISTSATFVTEFQNEASWVWSRRPCATASQIARVVGGALDLELGDFEHVRTVLSPQKPSIISVDDVAPPDQDNIPERVESEAVEDNLPGEELEDSMLESTPHNDAADSMEVVSDDGADENMSDDEEEPIAHQEPGASLVDQAVTANLRHWTHSFVGHKATFDEDTGHFNETRLHGFVETLECVSNQHVYTCGFVRSHRPEHPYLGVSPDGLCMLTASYGNRPCVIEYKTVKALHPDKFGARQIVKVDAGSDQYFLRVPHRFRRQLLAQVSILGLEYAMLVIAAPAGPHSVILIKYSHELTKDFLRLMTHPSISTVYKWFFDNAHFDYSDRHLESKIPAQAEPNVRALIASNLPMMRAVYLYQWRSTRPIAATKLFRFGIINTYDIGKAATDTFCKMVSELMRGRTFAQRWYQLVTTRFSYFPIIAALNLNTVYSYWTERDKSKDESTSLHGHRRAMRTQSGRITDAVVRVASKLFENPIAFERLGLPSTAHAVVTTTAATGDHFPFEVRCVHRKVMINELLKRAQTRGIAVSQADFIKCIPASSVIISDSTPSKRKIEEKYVVREEPVAHAFLNELPTLSNANVRRASLIKFWNSENGVLFRSNQNFWHHMELLQGRKNCHWCNSKTQVSVCGVCGPRLCLTCEREFHDGHRWAPTQRDPDMSEPDHATGFETPATASSSSSSSLSIPAPSSSSSVPTPIPLTSLFAPQESDSSSQVSRFATPGPKRQKIHKSN